MIRPFAALFLLLVACAAPASREIATPVLPEAWSDAASSVLAPELRWWSSFGDPVLVDLIERAAHSNPDVAIARTRLLEARALARAQGVSAKPSVDLAASASRSQPSENTRQGAFVGDDDLYQLGLDARWEPDFYGRLDAGIAAARAAELSALESLRAVRVSLFGELAGAYVELRGTERLLAVLRDNARVQSETAELTRARVDAGLATELDLSRAIAQLRSLEAEIPAIEARRQTTLNRIRVLLGGQTVELAPGGELPIPGSAIGMGTPSQWLERRPDLRQARAELERFSELARGAQADLYPRISLSARVGQDSNQFWNMLESGSNAWSIGGGLLYPIFDRTNLRERAAAADERARGALFQWQKAVLTAFAEVEDALSALARERERVEKLSQALDAGRKAVALAEELHERGVVDFFQVLDAQGQQLRIESQLAQARTQVSVRAVALYKSLGGGWEGFEEIEQPSAR